MNNEPEGLKAEGFYARLQRLAKAGEYDQALALMRTTDLPAMKRAFRTTHSGDGRFQMVFEFPSMAAMHEADSEWHAFRKATDHD